MILRHWRYIVLTSVAVTAVGAVWIASMLESGPEEHASPGEALEPRRTASATVIPTTAEPRPADAEKMDCEALGDAERTLFALQRQDLGEYYEQLKSAGNPRLTLELAAESVGLHPEAVRFGRIWLVGAGLEAATSESPYPLPRLPRGGARRLIDEHEVGSVFDAGKVGQVFKRFDRQRTVAIKSRDALGRRHDTSLLGEMIRRHGDNMMEWLPYVPDDWPIGVHELAVAIDSGVSAHDFEALLDLSGVDAAAGWRRHDPVRQVNLAEVASFRGRPLILRVLVARGANPVSGQSVLDDVVVRSTSAPSADGFENVVRQLVSAGARPRRPSTLAALDAQYPDLAGIGLHPDAAAALASGDVGRIVGRLAEIKLKWDVELEALHEKRRRCETTPYPGNKVQRAESATLTLAGKRRHDRWLNEQHDAAVRAALPETPHERETSHPYREDSEQIELGIKRAVDGRWDEAIALAEGMDPVFRAYYLESLLSLSLRRGAPMEVLETLVKLNAGLLPEDAILSLSERGWSGAPGVAEALGGFGLDVHHVDNFGRNAFSRLAESHPINLEMAALLASYSVSPKPNTRGMDPLDLVLSRMVRRASVGESEFQFARLLIDMGAPVESSHRELASRLASLDAAGFRRLVDVIPDLDGEAGIP